MNFSENLKKYRKNSGLSQEELGDKIKVTRQSISKWERGESYPDTFNILELCKIFNCSINDLVNDSIIDTFEKEIEMEKEKNVKTTKKANKSNEESKSISSLKKDTVKKASVKKDADKADSVKDDVKTSKKEVVSVKESPKALLSSDSQRCAKGFSKAVYIITKILEVFAYIGAAGISIIMIFLPLITNKIEITENSVGLKNNKNAKIVLVDEEGEYSINVGNTKVVDLSNTEVEILKKVLVEADLSKVVTYTEGVCLAWASSLIFLALALHSLHKLFENINHLDTPFTMENVAYINQAAYMLIGFLAAPIIVNLIFHLITGIDIPTSGGLTYLIEILVLFVLGYVFEYGFKLQQKSLGKMYGETNE